MKFDSLVQLVEANKIADDTKRRADTATQLYTTAIQLDKRLSPEEEAKIMQWGTTACLYANNIIKGRWKEYEDNLINRLSTKNNSGDTVINYMGQVIKERWPEIEPILFTKHVSWLYFYAVELKRRFVIGESRILTTDRFYVKGYKEHLKNLGLMDP